ncbi:MAG: type VII secretion protein EccB, partial [Mycobacterium sp.]|nr:type VII secretion protein EccB [Mycobacterium sp.]
VIVGDPEPASVRPLSAVQAILVTPGPRLPVYLLYGGHRAAVDLADAAVVRALRLEQRTPHVVSQSLLNAVPEVPPIATPRMRGVGAKSAALPAFPVGSVLRITRGDGDEFYAVLAAGVQRIGAVAADLLRLSDSQGAVNIISVAPDAIGTAPVLDTLPVASFPAAAPTIADAGDTVCASWTPAGHADVALLTGSGLPLPPGRAPVALAQADGSGPALDAVYLPPGRSVYVRGEGPGETRYLVTDTGVRFAIHDDDAAHDLGLAEPLPAPRPVLITLPSGPDLARSSASVARDTVGGGP